MKTCSHARGDWIADMGYWLCSSCWEKMPERPKEYGLATSEYGHWDGDRPRSRQVIVWQAETHTDQFGNTLSGFIRAMVKRFQFKTRPQIPTDCAYKLAFDVIRGLNDEFGDPAYDWSAAGAREMADEEMTYFDDASSSNA